MGGKQFYQLLGKEKGEIQYQWGFRSWKEIIGWHENISFLEEWFLTDYYGVRSPGELKKFLELTPTMKQLFRVGHLSF